MLEYLTRLPQNRYSSALRAVFVIFANLRVVAVKCLKMPIKLRP